MGNVARVFLRDVMRLLKTPAAWTVALALIVLPSLYTWFNVKAFWNPYDETGNLTVCVVNEDEGADNDLIGHLDVGSRLVEQLESNTQLGWEFVDRDTALEQVSAGDAYAAFVIPADFSADVTTIVSGDFQQPKLEYYVNEKSGPVSPKITDTGANTLDTTINEVFFATVSSTITEMVNERLADSKLALETGKSTAGSKVSEAAARIADARRTLQALADDIGNARGKAADAKAALRDAQRRTAEFSGRLDEIAALTADANTSMARFSTTVNSALDQSAADSAKTYAQATAALAKTEAAIESAKVTLDDVEARVDAVMAVKQELDQEATQKAEELLKEKEKADALVADRAEKLEAAKKEADAKIAQRADELAAVKRDADAKTSEHLAQLTKERDEADARVTEWAQKLADVREEASKAASELAAENLDPEARAKLEKARDAAEAKVAEHEQKLSDAKEAAKLAGDTLVAAKEAADAAVDAKAAELADAKEAADAIIDEKAASLADAKEEADRLAAEHAQALIDAKEAADAAAAAKVQEIEEARQRAEDAIAEAEATGHALDQGIQTTLDTARDFRAKLSSDVAPSISSALSDMAATSASLQVALSNQDILATQAIAAIDQLDSTLQLAGEALANTDDVLGSIQHDLETVQADLGAMSVSNALAELLGDGGIDPDKVADFMQSPTQIEPIELYAVNAYGSAMAPLFINLTLWIGVFMLMVIVRLEVDDEGIEGLTIGQRYLGRGAILSIMAACQACVCCTGCLAIGVQSANVPLFYLTAVIASLSYLAVQYTLSSALQHVGKAFCIILVFLQIPGATGLYPIEMTSDFFRNVYPLFPFTYGINAIRETIGGFYSGNWGSYIAMLGLFFVIFVTIGTLVRPYLANLNRLFAREIEESDIINGETVQVPARRYRLSEIVDAFVDRDEYRAELDARIARFMGLYPRLKTAAIVAGIGVPVVSTTVLGLLGIDKAIILTTWLAWLAFVVGALIFIEYMRDNLNHLVSLEAMSADEVRDAYSRRGSFVSVKPLDDSLKAKAHEKPQNPTEASETDAPEIEVPMAEAPEAIAPEAEAPEAESPAAEADVAESPAAESPVAEAPEAEAPAKAPDEGGEDHA